MSELTDRIKQRILDRTDFANDALEAAVEAHTANSFKLANAIVPQ